MPYYTRSPRATSPWILNEDAIKFPLPLSIYNLWVEYVERPRIFKTGFLHHRSAAVFVFASVPCFYRLYDTLEASSGIQLTTSTRWNYTVIVPKARDYARSMRAGMGSNLYPSSLEEPPLHSFLTIHWTNATHCHAYFLSSNASCWF